MSNEIKKCELHPVRLDSDVWAAVKAHKRARKQSLNQLLRKVLLSDVKPEAAIQKNVTPRVPPRVIVKHVEGFVPVFHVEEDAEGIYLIEISLVAESGKTITPEIEKRIAAQVKPRTELPRGEHVANMRGIRPKGDRTQ